MRDAFHILCIWAAQGYAAYCCRRSANRPLSHVNSEEHLSSTRVEGSRPSSVRNSVNPTRLKTLFFRERYSSSLILFHPGVGARRSRSAAGTPTSLHPNTIDVKILAAGINGGSGSV